MIQRKAELSAQLVDLGEETSRLEELLAELQEKRQIQLKLIEPWTSNKTQLVVGLCWIQYIMFVYVYFYFFVCLFVGPTALFYFMMFWFWAYRTCSTETQKHPEIRLRKKGKRWKSQKMNPAWMNNWQLWRMTWDLNRKVFQCKLCYDNCCHVPQRTYMKCDIYIYICAKLKDWTLVPVPVVTCCNPGLLRNGKEVLPCQEAEECSLAQWTQQGTGHRRAHVSVESLALGDEVQGSLCASGSVGRWIEGGAAKLISSVAPQKMKTYQKRP